MKDICSTSSTWAGGGQSGRRRDTASDRDRIPVQHTVATPYMVGPVHCYTAECAGELVLFDTGPPTDEGRLFLQQQIDLERLKHVIVTHCHIDHYGQSSWLEQNSDATIYLPHRDIMKIVRHDERLGEMYRLLADMGFGESYLGELKESFYRGVLFPPIPARYLTADNDIPERLGITVFSCPGHSQSDLVYGGESWAITGDTLLRGIFQSPLLDVDFQTGQRFNNYQAYCASIVTLAGLHGRLILPGHRQTIDSVEQTILFYVTKTLQRVRQLRPFVGRYSIAGIIERLFGSAMSDPFHIYLKASEIVFMTDFLEQPDTLRLALERIGLFEAVAKDFLCVVDP